VIRQNTRALELHGKSFQVIEYYDTVGERTHVALVCGEISHTEETWVRVHEPASLSDLIDDGRGRHAFGIQESLGILAKRGSGVLVLLKGQDADIGFKDFTRDRQRESMGDRKWDPRAHGVGAQILRDIGVGRMRIMSRPSKLTRFMGFDLEVTGFVTPQDLEAS
jgi:3,4-dihydroxy 2-butanone 4-phosphate synthase/GTP cyclohydrolase II